eukprot:6205393-Pleurochrysis_carterae.AAC.1
MVSLESYPRAATGAWAAVEKLSYLIGDFVWTAVGARTIRDPNPPFLDASSRFRYFFLEGGAGRMVASRASLARING